MRTDAGSDRVMEIYSYRRILQLRNYFLNSLILSSVSLTSAQRIFHQRLKLMSRLLEEYWQEPGRSIVDALLLPLPFPTSNGFDAASFKRVFHTVENNSILLEKDWNLKEIIVSSFLGIEIGRKSLIHFD